MKLKDPIKFLFAMLFIISIISMFLGVFAFSTDEVKKVKCYDRDNNVIEGMSCIEDGWRPTETGSIILVLGLFGMMIFGLSILERSMNKEYSNFFGFVGGEGI